MVATDLSDQEDLAYVSETSQRVGKLKIYFGYAAGVGKTYAMLSDAQEILKDGMDVVVGYVEPHDRPETTALLHGFEQLSPLSLSYKNMTLQELDLNAALNRQPDLILVDELAHTNAEGSRHQKRFQDVEELLRAGIDVYTTVNVQHIESLNDQVSAITGVVVRERIPDRLFDLADQIEVVDIEPIELIDRLNKGRIYQKHKIAQALSHFFTIEKLVALREIALRKTADHINRKANQHASVSKTSPAFTNEHILVCLSGSPSNMKVIRTAARMARAFSARLTAIYVEVADDDPSESYQSSLQANIRLAEDSGAQIVTIYGEDIPKQIIEYAQASKISKIVAGRTKHLTKWRSKQSFVDKLLDYDPNIDLHIIPDNQDGQPPRKKKIVDFSFSFLESLKSIFLLLICTLIGLWFYSLGFSEANIIIIYILGILINALLTKGRKYSLIASIVSVLIFNFTFTEPRFTFKVSDPGHIITFFIMLVAALITSTLTKRIAEQARQASRKAYYTEVLLETSQKLQKASDEQAIYNETAQQIMKLTNRSIVFYPSEAGHLTTPLFFDHGNAIGDEQSVLNEHEKAVAEWAFTNNKRAGASTQTLSNAKCLYLVIRGREKPLAVAGIVYDRSEKLGIFEKSLAIAMLDECALALDKEKATEAQNELYTEMQQEKLRSTLLRAISHDLRLPLTSISGNASLLSASADKLSVEHKQALYQTIQDDSAWLIRLIENLLSITKLDSGQLKLRTEIELFEEVIDEAISHLDPAIKEHALTVEISDDLLMAKMDPQLIVQVFVNILNNAVRYTPTGSTISITALRDGPLARIEISDDGNGLTAEEQAHIFDMFYTTNSANPDGRRGLGLGLFLCQSIIEAHGGTLYVKDHQPKGTTFGFTLEAEEVSTHE
ncbi:sensor histidine kinase [Marinilactibacillus kalidii]|uniref:sensor histidine kinase n=1 Tax=Marinilactibacillus kalidii TaxID=2820274 RepID=UPI001ABE954E|nr:sensor histidine kinase KdpD [Marinilactibacillus kalidii]